MGLDATVYCDCFEKAELLKEPDPSWGVQVIYSGSRNTSATDLDEQIDFDLWNMKFACKHESGVLLHHWIGNITLVGYFRNRLNESPDLFPILLEKVLYSGTHCGDILTVEEIIKMQPELVALSKINSSDPQDEEFLREFEQKMKDLSECALRVKKPITF